MAVSNSSSLSDLVGQIVSKQVQTAAYARRVLRPLVRVHHLPPGAGSMVVPRFEAVSVESLTEGVAPDTTQMNTIGKVLTPQERGVYVRISKRALHADPFADLSPYSNELASALAEDEDRQILSVMDFSETVDATGDVTLDSYLAAIAHLEGVNSHGTIAAVMHPVSWAKLRGELADAATYASVGTKVVEGFGKGVTNNRGFVGAPFGVPTFISTSVPEEGGVYQNKVFTNQAVAAGFIRDIGVDVDDNIPARALDLMAWYTVDTVQLIDEFGVNLPDGS